jgi:hypothetical protein
MIINNAINQKNLKKNVVPNEQSGPKYEASQLHIVIEFLSQLVYSNPIPSPAN